MKKHNHQPKPLPKDITDYDLDNVTANDIYYFILYGLVFFALASLFI